MITVSSCGVKLQEVLSGLEKESLKHWKYTCTFVAFLNIHFFFLSAWGVMSLGPVVSSVLDLCMECDIVQLSVYLILGYPFPHSLYFPIIMALC